MKALLATLLLATACAGTATVSGTATVGAPELVEVEPGVQVIVDYDEPIFYSDNYYWRHNGGRWYRSQYHDRGWVDASPPARVSHIQQPERYRKYRPANYQPRNGNNRPDPRGINRPDQRTPDKGNNRPDQRDGNNRPDSRDHDKDKDHKDRD